ncbi:hypothetical protein [Okeania sp. KiyG1]|uniref:hypothetical protein n=1 Tax=Okeania sp. KiyG1 TaxID=2720165 RepID=UPI001921A054|nr:hypothetical protein [Okeania sp. KiyG1]GGA34028.1 hypothetical protein CYANOKiyG1_51220 [Okeania sp. KiyG1]
MAKFDDEFNLKDWEWIAVPFPPSERESMARVAWSICCRCTPKEISRYNNLDPRIVIPLCAIVLLDKKYFLQLKKFAKEKEIGNYRFTQEFINLAINSIDPSKKWLSLFKTLDIELQSSLLYGLIKYRSPVRDDWRNIFLDIQPILNIEIELLLKLSLIIYLTTLHLFIVSFLPILRVEYLYLSSILIVPLIEDEELSFLTYIILTINLLYALDLRFIFSNKITLLISVLMSVLCSILWIILWIDEQKQQRKDTNPLKNILKSDSLANLINLTQRRIRK